MNIKIFYLIVGILLLFHNLLKAMELPTILTRNGGDLIGKTIASNRRPANFVISEVKFSRLNQSFEQIDALRRSLVESEDGSDFGIFMEIADAERKPGAVKQIFSIKDREAVFVRGNLADTIPYIYFVTGGIQNAVAVALYGHNPETGDYFTGLAHVWRGNRPSSIKSLLTSLSGYPVQQISLYAGYKSEILLNVFKYIKERNFSVTSVFVNDAYHTMNENGDVRIVFHPKYFGKANISEIAEGTAYETLIPPVHGINQKASSVILELKTGKLVDIPPYCHESLLLDKGINFRSVSDSLRVPGLSNTAKDFEIYSLEDFWIHPPRDFI